MPSLKFFTTTLFQQVSRSLPQMESSLRNTAMQLAKYTFAKTRFTSHVSFISSCLHLQVIPRGFQIKFHPGFSYNQYQPQQH